MSANISSPQLRIKLDELFTLVTNLSQELATLKALTVTGNQVVGGTLNAGASTLASAAVTGAATVGTTLGVTGATTLSGGLVSYGANDSGGAGFRAVLVPNV